MDGQLVIMHDVLGPYRPFRPWFAKCYIPDVIAQFSDCLGTLENVKQAGREQRVDGFCRLAELADSRYSEQVSDRDSPNSMYIYPISSDYFSSLK